MMRLDGKDPTVGDGFRIAFSKLGGIIAWALVSGTVGLILKSLERSGRRNFLVGIVVAIIGISWTLATFFVIPVMIAENQGPFSSIKRSVQIIREKWGEALVGRLGIGLIFGIIGAVIVLVLLGLFFAVPSLFLLWVGIGLLLLTMLSVISSALGGIFVAALYKYATSGQTGTGFDQTTMQQAFVPGSQ